MKMDHRLIRQFRGMCDCVSVQGVSAGCVDYGRDCGGGGKSSETGAKLTFDVLTFELITFDVVILT